MALQIANPSVVAKVEALSKQLGISKTAAVEQAVNRLIEENQELAGNKECWAQVRRLLDQMDQIPRNQTFVDPLQWDENGLPI